jgi:hypothetical protein
VTGKPLKPTAQFKSMLPTVGCPPNNNDNTFMTGLKYRALLDMAKDGAAAPRLANGPDTILQSVIKPLMRTIMRRNQNGYDDTALTYAELGASQANIIACNARNTKHREWTKLSVGSPASLCFPDGMKLFVESGVAADRFMQYYSVVHSIATSKIDAAGRPRFETGDEYFPPAGTTLRIDESLFKLFGVPGCSLTAIRNGNWALTVPSTAGPQTLNQSTPNVDRYFKGNNYKNARIRSNPRNPEKQVLLMCKLLGDLIQVIILLLWVIANPDAVLYTMMTCDKVVVLLCMVLGLNCAWSDYEKTPTGVKVRTLNIYESKGYSIEHARARFNREKTVIIGHNAQFIAAIKDIITKQGDENRVAIRVNGINDPFYFNTVFYRRVLVDLNAIQRALNSQTASGTTIEAVDAQIEALKLNYLLNLFIRKVGTQLKMFGAKKYVRGANAAVRTVPPGNSFFEIARARYNASIAGGGKDSNSQMGGAVVLVDDEVWNPLSFHEIVNFKVEPGEEDDSMEEGTEVMDEAMDEADRPIAADWGPDEIDADETDTDEIDTDKTNADETQPVNLHDELERQIVTKLKDNFTYFEDIYNELLLSFYLNNKVMYDDELTGEIDRIIRDELYLPDYKVMVRKPGVFRGVDPESAKNRRLIVLNKTRKMSKASILDTHRGIIQPTMIPAHGGKRTRRLTRRSKTRKNNKKRSITPVLLS